MSKPINEALLIDYLSGALSPEEEQWLKQEIAQSPELHKEYEALKALMQDVGQLEMVEPPVHMRIAFENIIEQEKLEMAKAREAKVISARFWRQVVGVAAILGLGIFIGGGMQYYFFQSNEIAAVQEELETTRAQIEELMTEESTAKKIRAVNMSMELPKVDQELRTQLIYLLHKDESTNVRLSALEALQALAEVDPTPTTRQALVSALRVEEKPVVQISLIHALVQLKANEAIPAFDDLINRETTMDKVKDEARLGKFKLL